MDRMRGRSRSPGRGGGGDGGFDRGGDDRGRRYDDRGGGGYKGGGQSAPREGDWTCPGCSANVFAAKMEVSVSFCF